MCIKPLHRFVIGERYDSSGDLKEIARVTSSDVNYIKVGQHIIDKFIEIPCGQCIECRLAYSRMWAIRCMKEAELWNENCFITLTYDNKHLPLSKYGTATLRKQHMSQFMKNFRKKYGEGIRFFGCGEYGDETHRSHLHIILFNVPVFRRVFWYVDSKTGQPVYRCPEIEKIWRQGNVVIDDVTWNSCAYVARYVVKKVKGKSSKEHYDFLDEEPEFVLMSRRPGIAYDWFKQNKDKIYSTDEIFFTNKKGTHVCKPPRYFDNLYEVEAPELIERLKERRKDSMYNKKALEALKTSLTEAERSAFEERLSLQKVKLLHRNVD